MALSSADCAARRQERGVLQQLLLLVFAAPLRSRLAQQLGELQGVPCADVPAREVGSSGGSAAADAAMELASEAATAAATADAPEACAPAASYRLFVVARRVTVALVDSPAELASLLDFEARPYIPGKPHLDAKRGEEGGGPAVRVRCGWQCNSHAAISKVLQDKQSAQFYH